ncbi:MAG: MerR family DNA-binding protein, partial [Alphaproteobacteria bacterium]|nr:MerR family DNA-binding protein [Alphaproteobacteria bacterium]
TGPTARSAALRPKGLRCARGSSRGLSKNSHQGVTFGSEAGVAIGCELTFSLDELRELLRLVDGRAYTCKEVRALTFDHVADIRRKIADLKRLERALTDIAARCSGKHVPECPVIDALFAR